MKQPDEHPGARNLPVKGAGARGIEKMKILLQHKNNGHYKLASGDWTTEREAALAFDRSQEALVHCERNGIRDVDLRYCFSDPRFDFCVHPFGRDDAPAAQAARNSAGDRTGKNTG